VEVHGEILPQGSMIQMGHISYDEEYVDDPNQFRPERWMAEAVMSRKGSKSEVLDHAYHRDPFSQGKNEHLYTLDHLSLRANS
jgi:cytochrome P450